MSARRVPGSGGLAMLVMSALETASVPPLQCPEGTRQESRILADKSTKEFCVDIATGLREGPERQYAPNGTLTAEGSNHAGKFHGPARIFSATGELLAESTFDHGKLKTIRYTAAGLQKYIAGPLNEQLRAEGEPAEVAVIDERTMRLDYRFEDADSNSTTGKEKLDRFRNYHRRDACRLFTGNEGLETIEVRVFNGDGGQPQMEDELNRADCPGN